MIHGAFQGEIVESSGDTLTWNDRSLKLEGKFRQSFWFGDDLACIVRTPELQIVIWVVKFPDFSAKNFLTFMFLIENSALIRIFLDIL